MAEIVNLRRARKQMNREQERAELNRLMQGRPKAERRLQAARAEKARRQLDGHRLPPRGPA